MEKNRVYFVLNKMFYYTYSVLQGVPLAKQQSRINHQLWIVGRGRRRTSVGGSGLVRMNEDRPGLITCFVIGV